SAAPRARSRSSGRRPSRPHRFPRTDLDDNRHAEGPPGRRPFSVCGRRGQPTRKLTIRVVDWSPAVIVIFTFRSLPLAFFGTVNGRLARPFAYFSRCGITFPAIEGSQVMVPSASRLPSSLRATGKTRVNRLPATALAGVAIGFPTTGLTTGAGAGGGVGV